MLTRLSSVVSSRAGINPVYSRCTPRYIGILQANNGNGKYKYTGKGLSWQQHRPYFWNSSSSAGDDGNQGSNNDDDNDDENNNDNDTKKLKEKIKEKSTSSERKLKGNNRTYVPSRLGFGDESPRYPHLIGLPVTHRPVFPGLITTVNITDLKTIEALERINEKGSGYIGVFLRNDTHNEHGMPNESHSRFSEGGLLVKPEIITEENQLHKIGTFAQVHRVHRNSVTSKEKDNFESDFSEVEHEDEDGDNVSASVLLLAHRRIDLLSVDNFGPPIDVTVKHWDRLPIPSENQDMIRALTNEILSTIREVAQMSPLFREHIHYFSTKVDANDPFRLADFAASITTGSPEELQAVLAERDPEARLHKALVLLNKEREVSKLQQEIQSQVESKMSEAQRKYFLREQLKSIKKELGEEMDDKDALFAKFKKKLHSFTEIPEEAKKAIKSELDKLGSLEKNSSEFNVTKSYLDWLTSIPWDNTTEESFDIKQAKGVLDRDHYG